MVGLNYFRNFTVAKCCVAYKLIKGEVPLYIEDSLRLKSQQHSRVTGCSNINFICPKSNRVSEGGRTFAVTTCYLWKSLSLELRKAVSLESFKNNYRNILFKE